MYALAEQAETTEAVEAGSRLGSDDKRAMTTAFCCKRMLETCPRKSFSHIPAISFLLDQYIFRKIDPFRSRWKSPRIIEWKSLK